MSNKHESLKSLFDDIADAIRSKDGTNTTIVADTFPERIAAIDTNPSDANLKAENIADGITIFGITGTYSSDATATAADIIKGTTAYANGSKLTGTLVVQNYYTGATAPDSSLGNNGDLYFKV